MWPRRKRKAVAELGSLARQLEAAAAVTARAPGTAFIIKRGCCEESRRRAAVRSAWGHVPADARAVLKTPWSPRPKDSFGIAVGPLRVEGLPRWSKNPRNSIPECSALGPAARVAAWAVGLTPESILATVGAPEIADG